MQKNKRNVVSVDDKIRFRNRLNEIEKYIPGNYKERILKEHPEADLTISRLYNTREGKQVDFKILGYLEDLAEEEKAKINTQSH